MNNIQAVIFDMDGVIFDTEPLHSREWKAAMESFGVNKPLVVGLISSKTITSTTPTFAKTPLTGVKP